MVTELADALDMEPRQVRVFFYEGASSFGAAQTRYDMAKAAAIMSQIAGKPVRLQLMRWDEHGWDQFGPAQLMDMRGGIDANGKIVALDYTVLSQPSTDFDTSLELTGTPYPAAGTASPRNEAVGEAYAIPNKRTIGKTVPVFEGYLKRGNLRNPQGPQTAFAAEQMIDELAYAAKMDPLEFRRQNITDQRYLGALNAVAQAAGWQPRVAASNVSDANIVTGRGFSFGRHGSAGMAASVVEIEVNRKSGKILVKHLFTAMDTGLAVNPGLIENQMSGAGVMGVSRALHETVSFNRTNVTALDWVSYPILRFREAPKVTTVVVSRPEFPPLGAGEPPHQPIPPAIANAFFDATGVRIREAPMTPDRVRAVLKAAGK
jgi:CO/xanthine dehydrogenase Mo-binding subunit